MCEQRAPKFPSHLGMKTVFFFPGLERMFFFTLIFGLKKFILLIKRCIQDEKICSNMLINDFQELSKIS